MRVAIVGSGIAGLAAAHTLAGHARVTLYEAGPWFGGHTHTVDVTLPTAQGPVTHGVDTGFLVFNERTYPRLIELFAQLGVPTVKSDMSFSVQVPDAFRSGPLEWSGSSLNTVFAQRANLGRPRFLRMLRDLLRFNRLATACARSGQEAQLLQPLGEFLADHRFSDEFRDWYLLPMIGCIWSCPTDQMLRFPVATLVRFCHNHGLLQVTDRPQWWTVAGGARGYVDKILAGIGDQRLNTPVRKVIRSAGGATVVTDGGSERFDHVVMATHPDQALAVLADVSAAESELLGAIRYQRNRAVLHTDASALPRRRSAWAAWNYESGPAGGGQVCLHYWLNRLQPLPWPQPVLVSLNPLREIARNKIMGEYEYEHPVFDRAAIAAQAGVTQLQGQRRTWFCGAWTGYGFHEDGLKAGQRVGRALRDGANPLPATGVRVPSEAST
ncbi:NAD(P)/FAD-dependent oxidoreductase [Caenimonas terrae]|uniref:NAD(P)/FAD-dependent oxidoreductase n=1 Tax=Caenimonas terrae TaxID=696074 RepID=A0ABW0NC19_9BURK